MGPTAAIAGHLKEEKSRIAKKILKNIIFPEEASPVIDVLVAGVFHQGSVNCVNSGLQLMLRHSPSVAQHLRGGISEGTQEEGNIVIRR